MIHTINKLTNFVNSKAMVVIDFLGAFGVLGYAAYLYSNNEDYKLWAGIGLAALIMAILRPTKLITKKINK